MTPLATENYKVFIQEALKEDIKDGDRTTDALVSPVAQGAAKILFKEKGLVAGLPIAIAAFNYLEPSLETDFNVLDGDNVESGQIAASIRGHLRALLTGERTALNFLQKLCGIATYTQKHVDAVRGTGAKIFDTRKTTPGWRALEKYAVRVGGGQNHRFGLYDQILIKDNHLNIISSYQNCSIDEAVRIAIQKTREENPTLKIEVEVENDECFIAAVNAGADIILLDNQPPSKMKDWVEWLKKHQSKKSSESPILEASGGITLKNIREVAETGVDRISLGALTHSAPSLDISLEIETSE